MIDKQYEYLLNLQKKKIKFQKSTKKRMKKKNVGRKEENGQTE